MNTTAAASIDIDTSRPETEYSRHIFGHFIEHFHRQVYGGIFEPGSPLADEQGFRLDVLDALRELKVPNVRWPGGSFVSAYHWADGIGSERIPVYDRAWRVTDPNTFGTDEFLSWCEALGADPYICTNAGTGTPEEMADWVEYTNRPAGSKWSNKRVANGWTEPRRVPFWSIGNENYMEWEVGTKTGDEWAAFVKESAKIITRTDDSVQLLAAATANIQWVAPLLDLAGRYLSYLSIHGYWDDLAEVNEPGSYLQAMSRTLQPEEQIALARSMIQSSGHNHIKIAFDEWNLRSWHHPSGNSPEAIQARDLNDDNSTYTMADAVFSACFLNSCLRNGDIVGMANLAPTVNARGPLFVHTEGVVKRTTFHLMSLYANSLGGRVLPAHLRSVDLDTGFGSVPQVDAIVTTDDDNSLTIVLVNKSEASTVDVAVTVDGKRATGMHQAIELAGDSADAYNDVGNPDAVVPAERLVSFDNGVTTLPAHSVTVITYERTP